MLISRKSEGVCSGLQATELQTLQVPDLLLQGLQKVSGKSELIVRRLQLSLWGHAPQWKHFLGAENQRFETSTLYFLNCSWMSVCE